MIEKHQPKATEILYMRRLPGRVNSEQAAQLLGMQPHHLPILCRRGLLRPLGGGPKNCVKYYASLEIEQLCTDFKWLAKATKLLSDYRPHQQESGLEPCSPR
jgi:hypothetical protein